MPKFLSEDDDPHRRGWIRSRKILRPCSMAGSAAKSARCRFRARSMETGRLDDDHSGSHQRESAGRAATDAAPGVISGHRRVSRYFEAARQRAARPARGAAEGARAGRRRPSLRETDVHETRAGCVASGDQGQQPLSSSRRSPTEVRVPRAVCMTRYTSRSTAFRPWRSFRASSRMPPLRKAKRSDARCAACSCSTRFRTRPTPRCAPRPMP